MNRAADIIFHRLEVNSAARPGQRGSALLFVLVMSAIIAIMLYRIMPIAAFEAQRQKEELTVQRGGEYQRAVKLFVRKFGRFPSTVAELESTNRMRFLRQKYTDPLTGKDDWRLVHAGPGGIITDSKVKDPNAKGDKSSTLGAAAAFAGFNNSFAPPPDSDSALAGVPSAALRQRPAATGNAGSIAGPNDFPPLPSTSADESPHPVIPGIGNGQGLYPDGSVPAANGSPHSTANPALAGMAQGLQAAGQSPTDPTTTLANDPQVLAAMAAAGISSGIGSNGIGNGGVAQQLSAQNPQMPQGPMGANGQQPSALQNSAAFTNGTQVGQQQQNGQGLTAGGIAGVASIAKGASIKLVNDQKKYSLWEFYYDMRKDQSKNAAGALQQRGLQQNGSNNSNSAFGSSNSGFGSSTSNSGGFGTSGSQNTTSPNSPPPSQIPPATPPPSPLLN